MPARLVHATNRVNHRYYIAHANNLKDDFLKQSKKVKAAMQSETNAKTKQRMKTLYNAYVKAADSVDAYIAAYIDEIEDALITNPINYDMIKESAGEEMYFEIYEKYKKLYRRYTALINPKNSLKSKQTPYHRGHRKHRSIKNGN